MGGESPFLIHNEKGDTMTHIAIICIDRHEFQDEVIKLNPHGKIGKMTQRQIEITIGRKTCLYRMIQVNPYKPGMVEAIERQTRNFRFDKYYISQDASWRTDAITMAMRRRLYF